MGKKSVYFTIAFLLITGLSMGVFATQVHAGKNEAYIYRGAQRVISAPLKLPNNIYRESHRSPFPIGLMVGTVKGLVKMTTGLVFGALDLAIGAAPYAKYALLA
jgi:hypothetical protein